MPEFLCQNCQSGCACREDCTCLDAGGCRLCDCGDGATDAYEIDPETQEVLSFLAGRPNGKEYTDPAPPGSPGLAPESVALASRLAPDPHPHKWQLNRQLMRYKCQTCGLLSLHNYD